MNQNNKIPHLDEQVKPGDDENVQFYFNPEVSVILGDYLDILLNRDSLAGRRNLPAFEKINYSLNPENKLIPIAINEGNSYKDAETLSGIGLGLSKESETSKMYPFEGGILLPHQNKNDCFVEEGGDEGSGNIVIMGAAGTGKSTLAFQIAAACASRLNHGIAVYYTLEVSFQQFKHSMVRLTPK